MSSSQERIGLIAGSGTLASEFLARAREKRREVAVVALSAGARGPLEAMAAAIAVIGPTQPKKIVRFLLGEGVRRVGFAGKVEKRLLFQPLKFDLEALRFLQRARNTADVTVMDAVIEFLERNGLEVLPQTEFLDHLLAPSGPLGNRRLREVQRKDAEYAFQMARDVARLDIGQTVVVRRGAVVAVEAVEGTDEAIRRGCLLAGKGAVVCKVARPRQDLRYDIPVVGPETIQILREGGAAALVIEAGRTFLLDRERLIREADSARIAVMGWSSEGRS